MGEGRARSREARGRGAEKGTGDGDAADGQTYRGYAEGGVKEARNGGEEGRGGKRGKMGRERTMGKGRGKRLSWVELKKGGPLLAVLEHQNVE